MSSVEHVRRACSLSAEWFRDGFESLRTRLREDDGASLVEYALLISLIAIVCVSAMSFFGHQVSSRFSSQGSCLAAAGNVATPNCK
jgi:pilus assembly protein Flp/PilA